MEPVTVWRVQLRRGDVREREGTLRLDDDAIVFEDRASAQQTRIALSTVVSARRVRASPILMVEHDDGVDARARTAFYFSQPPPLDTPPPGSTGTSSMGRPLGPFAAFRRTSRRRHQRDNVKYLTTTAAGVKATIRAWESGIAARTKR